MKLIDYNKKIFLKLYKKRIEIKDSHEKQGYYVGYQRYFNYVLQYLNSDLVDALKTISKNKVHQKKDSKLLNHIYVMWWQGVESAPVLVQNNIARMQEIFGKDRVCIITEQNWKQYCNLSNTIMKKFAAGKISIAALSDIIRFNLLKNYGGLWIDSTVILNNNSASLLAQFNNRDFFTISNLDEDYHYISKSKWTVWFIGGRAGYPLFEFVTAFYNKYFEKHDFLIDYYTTDDIIAYFYVNNNEFKNDISSISYKWNPYLWSQNMYNPYKKEYIEKFKHEDMYSIQKFTYKYDESLSKNKDTVLYAILNNSFK